MGTQDIETNLYIDEEQEEEAEFQDIVLQCKKAQDVVILVNKDIIKPKERLIGRL